MSDQLSAISYQLTINLCVLVNDTILQYVLNVLRIRSRTYLLTYCMYIAYYYDTTLARTHVRRSLVNATGIAHPSWHINAAYTKYKIDRPSIPCIDHSLNR